MGTLFTTDLWCADVQQCESGFTAVRDSLTRIDSLMSVYHASELTRINHAAGSGEYLQPVSTDTLTVLRYAIDIAAKSEGLFEPTILPLLKAQGLFRENFATEIAPAEQHKIAEAKRLVNYRKVRIERNRAGLMDKGMELDFGGIAKGYALDDIAARLTAMGIRQFVLNFGGHLLVRGITHATTIADPDGSGTLARCRIGSGSLSVSAQDKRYVTTDGRKKGHLIHPQSGEPHEKSVLALVYHDSAMAADAWSTALFFATPADFERVTLKQQIAAVLVEQSGTMHVSDLFAAKKICEFSTKR